MKAFIGLEMLLLLLVLNSSDARKKKPSFNIKDMARGLPPGVEPEPETTTTERPEHVGATYYVTFSSKLLPGTTFPVRVKLVKEGDVSFVSVSLRNSSNDSIIFAEAPSVEVVGGGPSAVINLDLPQDLKPPSYRDRLQYAVRVIAEGDVAFNQSKVVSFNRKRFSIFVQTDKGLYKPGQTVKIRALAMNRDLTLRNDPMDILIVDPQGNKIKLWKNVTGFENTGVVERNMVTSMNPPLGDWTIDVTVLGQTESKKFAIKEYVLPKFEAILEMPDLALDSAPALTGKAKAMYTFGKPLVDASVLVTLKCSYYGFSKDREQPILTEAGMVDKNGEFRFAFYRKELLDLVYQNQGGDSNKNRGRKQDVRLAYQNMIAIVNITNTNSGHKMSTQGSVRFVTERAILKFLPNTPSTYKPGLKFRAYVSVERFDSVPFPNYKDINVSFTVSAYVPRPTTTTTIPLKISQATTSDPKMKDGVFKKPEEELKMKEPARRRPYFTPTEEVELAVINKTLTPTGLLVVEVDVPSNTESIAIEAFTMGQSMRYSAQKATSPSDNFLQIQPQVETPKVGHTMSLQVKSTESVDKIVYQIYTKGILLEDSEAPAVDKEKKDFRFSFFVTNKMAPNIRVLVFYFRQDGEVVADSASYNVEMRADTSMNVTFNKKKVKPGENVLLELRAEPGSTVFLLGIDKSVKLLKSGNDITQSDVDSELIQYDFGGGFHGFWRYMMICGWPYPGRGADADGVFNDAQVVILTDGTVYRKERGRYPYNGPPVMRMRVATAAGFGTDTALKVAVDSRHERLRQSSAAERVRSLFPETWLWDYVVLGY